MNMLPTVESNLPTNKVAANILAAVAALMMLAMIVAALALAACRQTDPTIDPKTPANSPFPELDRREPDPKSGPPSLTSADAG
jgi:hypothetical protein